jgi:hypothetical protein
MGLAERILAALGVLAVCGLGAQVISFEQNGLKYKTLSLEGATVMYAPLSARLHDYAILQVGVMNGSENAFTVRPEDLSFRREDGSVVYAAPAREVVDHLLEHAGRDDVIKLIATYEMSLSGVTRFRSTNGYEARRENALAEIGSAKLKAAATASAIAFITIKLEPGESTDGAVFFATGGKPLGPGALRAHVAGHFFDFESEGSSSGKELQQRPAPSPPANPDPRP